MEQEEEKKAEALDKQDAVITTGDEPTKPEESSASADDLKETNDAGQFTMPSSEVDNSGDGSFKTAAATGDPTTTTSSSSDVVDDETKIDVALAATSTATAIATTATNISTDETLADKIQVEISKDETGGANNDNSASSKTALGLNNGLQHNFVPGDHVIRWEMLPIVWPIQIHGIVLEVGRDYVSICDFGLTATEQPQNEKDKTDNHEKEDSTKNNSTEENETVTQKNTKKFLAAWDRAVKKPLDTTTKERITVHTIITQDDLSRWKKVNYGQGLFGTGPSDEEGVDAAYSNADNDDSQGTLGVDDNEQERQQQAPKQQPQQRQFGHRVGKWWQSVRQRTQSADDVNVKPSATLTEEEEEEEDNINTGGKYNFNRHDTEEEVGHLNAINTLIEETDSLTIGNSHSDPSLSMDANEKETNAETATATTETSDKSSSLSPSKSEPTLSTQDAADSTNNPDGNTAASTSPTRVGTVKSRFLQRISQHRLNKKRGNRNARSKSPTKDNDKKPKLPKSDPPKLVLARTTFLLEHGETVLPPYHPFKANSECIAVFCKTGRWSTLQASVFLHSTAIGNAKGAVVTTMGVAASVPLLAPAIAGIGLVAVGAPYVLLNQSKEFWQTETIRLNDLVWSQAKPEVFVECIEKWSHLEQYYENKEKLQKLQAEQKAEEDENEKKADGMDESSMNNDTADMGASNKNERMEKSLKGNESKSSIRMVAV